MEGREAGEREGEREARQGKTKYKPKGFLLKTYGIFCDNIKTLVLTTYLDSCTL